MSELLTPEEGEAAVNEWVNEDWATRYIQLNRGHWEYIVPVIAKAQLAKQGSEEADTVKRYLDRGWTPPEELGMKIEQAKREERERILFYLGNDRGFGLVKKVQALKANKE